MPIIKITIEVEQGKTEENRPNRLLSWDRESKRWRCISDADPGLYSGEIRLIAMVDDAKSKQPI